MGRVLGVSLPFPHTRQLVLGGLVATFAVFGVFISSGIVTLEAFAAREAQLRSVYQSHPLATVVMAWLIYATLTGLSLPVATFLTLSYGWFFGFFAGLVISSLASTAGATLAMLLSRYLFYDSLLVRLSPLLGRYQRSLDRQAPACLFMLCLNPVIPFFTVNALMGITKIPVSTFWWVSQLGMLPGTMMYVYAGASVPSLRSLATQGVYAIFTPQQVLQTTVAFALVGALPLIIRMGLNCAGAVNDFNQPEAAPEPRVIPLD